MSVAGPIARASHGLLGGHVARHPQPGAAQ